jgi:tRNA uridine 5-carboxymethylaminomethyl modification enzyme
MYEIIVVGGGHAGCEASLATARKGHKTLLITGNINMVASMPCNPSIGGPAKGVVVREIDALGGEMARLADKTTIQMRLLNVSKGPAVRALRAQSDKDRYSLEMKKVLLEQENLDVLEGYVTELLIIENQVKGVKVGNQEIKGNKVILTTGTYMKSKVMIGDDIKEEGPDKQKASLRLSPQLRDLGFKTTRLKTGTPPRITRDSVNFDVTEEHPGDQIYRSFSFDENYYYDIDKQYSCYLTYTNQDTHEIIDLNLEKSSMYSGQVEGVGPRYCPSIEDKYVRFNDKKRHQLFLEPDSLELDEIYIQGLSSSMPRDIQRKMVHSIKGLENAEITKYAYAIEYDAIDPQDLYPTLESKIIKDLYFAGQVNGTSGYEEAACQGLMAGINASLHLEGNPPLVLQRDEAYIGVLIDDLINKGVTDPYRLLTSRAEYRLLLRHDNADTRLMHHGFRVGLLEEQKYNNFIDKTKQINQLKETLLTKKIFPNKEINSYLEMLGTAIIRDKISLYELIRRPEIHIQMLDKLIDINPFSSSVIEQVEIDIKYEGYIEKAKKQARKMLKNDEFMIPNNVNYHLIPNLAEEAKEKLSKIRPLTIGQAGRISGVNPADIQILMVYLRK